MLKLPLGNHNKMRLPSLLKGKKNICFNMTKFLDSAFMEQKAGRTQGLRSPRINRKDAVLIVFIFREC